MSFETELQAIKTAVAKLEEGGLPLAESVEVYREGLRAAKACEAELLKEKGALKLLKNDFTDADPEENE